MQLIIVQYILQSLVTACPLSLNVPLMTIFSQVPSIYTLLIG
jgi:hypothetical protein